MSEQVKTLFNASTTKDTNSINLVANDVNTKTYIKNVKMLGISPNDVQISLNLDDVELYRKRISQGETLSLDNINLLVDQSKSLTLKKDETPNEKTFESYNSSNTYQFVTFGQLIDKSGYYLSFISTTSGKMAVYILNSEYKIVNTYLDSSSSSIRRVFSFSTKHRNYIISATSSAYRVITINNDGREISGTSGRSITQTSDDGVYFGYNKKSEKYIHISNQGSNLYYAIGDYTSLINIKTYTLLSGITSIFLRSAISNDEKGYISYTDKASGEGFFVEVDMDSGNVLSTQRIDSVGISVKSFGLKCLSNGNLVLLNENSSENSGYPQITVYDGSFNKVGNSFSIDTNNTREFGTSFILSNNANENIFISSKDEIFLCYQKTDDAYNWYYKSYDSTGNIITPETKLLDSYGGSSSYETYTFHEEYDSVYVTFSYKTHSNLYELKKISLSLDDLNVNVVGVEIL